MNLKRWVQPVVVFLVVMIGALALALAVKSLWSPVEHDGPVLLYPSHLVFTGQRIIYRDLFDMNFPGSYVVYGLLGSVTAMSEPLMRLVDVLLFALLSVVVIRAIDAGNKLYPLLAMAVFGCYYFADVPFLTLQREYFVVICLFLSASLMRKTSRRGLDLTLGLAASFAFLIKPHSILAFVWLAVIRWADVKALGSSVARALTTQLVGFFGLITVTIGYLSFVGGLGPFIGIVTHYLPLYGAMDGSHLIAPPDLRRQKLLTNEMLADGRWWLFLVAVFVAGLLISRKSEDDHGTRRSLRLMLGWTCIFWIYPALSGGQFWVYHWLPFNLSLLLLTMLCFQVAVQSGKLESIAVGLVAGCALWSISSDGYANLLLKIQPAKNGRVDEIAQFLRAKLKPGDTVQPLDWTGGAVHAMLRSNAAIATRFVYDFHFYHHVSNPYIRGLRATFLDEFDKSNPRFVVQYLGPDKPWPSGPDTTKSFPDLQRRLASRYWIVYEGDQFQILQRLQS